MKAIAALFLAAALAAGCGLADPETTAYPLPSTPIAWPLPTQAEATAAGCPATELEPVKVEWDAVRRALSVGGEKVVWPRGFSARILPNGRLEILAPNGTVMARDGDTISVGGADYEHVCRVQSVQVLVMPARRRSRPEVHMCGRPRRGA